MRLIFTIDGIRGSISMLAVLGVLVAPALAQATTGATTSADGTGAGGDVGSGEGAGSGDSASGGATGVGTTSEGGEATTTGASTSGDTDDASPVEDDDKGCSIGGRGLAPGMMVLGLLGLHALRRRR